MKFGGYGALLPFEQEIRNVNNLHALAGSCLLLPCKSKNSEWTCFSNENNVWEVLLPSSEGEQEIKFKMNFFLLVNYHKGHGLFKIPILKLPSF